MERDRVCAAYQQKMSILLDCLIKEKQWDDVLTWSENWILHGYSTELAYRALMYAHAGKGDLSLAMATYHRCSEALERDLGVSPSLETQQLIEQLRDGVEISTTLRFSPPPSQIDQPPFLIKDQSEFEKNLFVSRECELNQLDYFINDVKSGRGKVAIITGEAGSGKTSLIQEFTDRAIISYQNMIVTNGYCNAHSVQLILTILFVKF